ncbi:unnamed product [Ostreococcus tauri]|uniref:Unnamed product n=1 Tax=Ostreococcus tauri TaxID=70448 RepID=A0A090MC69_OSTTA|nr:unnamed product [Ostreococcus tauri]CEF99699.1 unnamed product [Ostreococcus tauri]|eukprot:XP_022839978.1 unnamed product [Ostreococcus tauri]
MSDDGSASDGSMWSLPASAMRRRKEGEEARARCDGAVTPAWIAAARVRRWDEDADEDDAGGDAGGTGRDGRATTTTTTEGRIEALLVENASLKRKMREMARDFDAHWETETAAVRAAVRARDAEWTRRVDRYRRIASEVRAAHEVDRAKWAAVERSREKPSTAAIEKLKSDVARVKTSLRELKSVAELANRLVAPAVACALDGVRRTLGGVDDAAKG